MKAQLNIYGSTQKAFVGGIEGGADIDNAMHLEFITRVFLLSCEHGLQARLGFSAGDAPDDERLEPFRWKRHDVFLSPSWRAICEEEERREHE